ncbi:hypothetical protein BDF14DRAFT_1751569 [Spinellus fusiger]|nr:hypothetical protein BDF14DRAFT_1751569 [Spinellus fusiger]
MLIFTVVFLSLLQSCKPNRQANSSKSRTSRELINSHRDIYFQHSLYEPAGLNHAGSKEINTAYLNGVSLHFGNNLRMLLNILLKKNERTRHRIKTAISSGRRFSS